MLKAFQFLLNLLFVERKTLFQDNEIYSLTKKRSQPHDLPTFPDQNPCKLYGDICFFTFLSSFNFFIFLPYSNSKHFTISQAPSFCWEHYLAGVTESLTLPERTMLILEPFLPRAFQIWGICWAQAKVFQLKDAKFRHDFMIMDDLESWRGTFCISSCEQPLSSMKPQSSEEHLSPSLWRNISDKWKRSI